MRKVILAVAIMGGAPGLAYADTREDVVAGLTRCAALTDDRQWLDCYYGAAQPMRAWLGLSPAPQSQLKLLSVQPTAGRAARHRHARRGSHRPAAQAQDLRPVRCVRR